MSLKIDKNRRNILLGSAAIATGIGWGIKPEDVGENHSPYFSTLSKALDDYKVSKPSLVIDKQKLLKNIKVLNNHLKGRFDYRIVVKSLPSIGLVKFIMANSKTKRLMVFHQPFLSHVAKEIPDADILMGKPMPIAAAEKYYQQVEEGDEVFDHQTQLQWLIDSPARLHQYSNLSSRLKTKMNINIELDVGLHRGGVSSVKQLEEMLSLISNSKYLTFSGFMGYEPHISKAPGGFIPNRDKAMEIYQEYVHFAEIFLKRKIGDLCLNSAGSPTYQAYIKGNYPHNEISAGSCLVKPTDFDLVLLSDHVPASYIATPVLKTLEETKIPGGLGIGKLMSLWNPNRQKTFFTYGGYWKAIPESPKGLSTNPLYGRSSNQEMYNGSVSINLQPDDWIFMRPSQSESVFLQFNDILLYDDGKIVEHWPVFSC